MEIVFSDEVVIFQLNRLGFTQSAEEGRLMIVELSSKAGAGYMNSHTEELFLNSFYILKKDRTLNKLGRKFMMHMLYEHSNLRPRAFNAMQEFRRES